MRQVSVRLKGRPLAALAVVLLLLLVVPAALSQQPSPGPELLTPPASFITSNPRPTLSWQAVPGATSYEIQISDTPEFGRTVTQTAEVVNATRFTSAQLSNGKYYWHVRAMADGVPLGGWSMTREFTVDTSYPVRPDWMGESWIAAPLYGVPAGDPTGQIVINELCAGCYLYGGGRAAVEFYNAGSTPVNMTNWKMTVWWSTNVRTIVYYFPEVTLNPGAYLTVYEGSGSDWLDPGGPYTYLGPNIIYPYNATNYRGAIALESTAPTGIDFLRFRATFGTSSVAPPKGTKWSGPDPLSNQFYYSIGRDWYSFDADKGADWTEQADSLELQNSHSPTAKPSAAPVQVSPAANAFVANGADVAVWKPAFNAEWYNLQVSTLSTCASPNVLNVAFIYGTEWPMSVSPDGVYYWRVQGENFLGAGPWSKCLKFTKDTVAPATPPVLISPTDGSSMAVAKPVLKWSAVSGAAQYEVALELYPFGDPAFFAYSKSTSFTTPTALVPGGYYWRVRALDAAGNAGPWSNGGASWYFYLTSPASAAPILYYFGTAYPDLSWDAVSWANGYEIQVADNTAFKNPVYVYSDIPRDWEGWTVGPLPKDGLYYWRIRARRDDGTWGPWSKTQTFYASF